MAKKNKDPSGEDTGVQIEINSSARGCKIDIEARTDHPDFSPLNILENIFRVARVYAESHKIPGEVIAQALAQAWPTDDDPGAIYRGKSEKLN